MAEETKITHEELYDEFIKLRAEAIWLRTTINMFNHLFDSSSEIEQILRKSAESFFTDLNIILHEYIILKVYSLTGPPKTYGISNLSTQRLTIMMQQLGCITTEIECLNSKLKSYGELLKPARNKIISHMDLETYIKNTPHGEHDENELNAFLENLQTYFDAVGNAIGIGPLDFRATPCTGDVIDLIRILKEYQLVRNSE